MAQKRPSTVVDHQQPSPSSSDQDHEEEEEEEEEVSSSSEEDVDEEPAPPPAPAPNKKPTSKQPPPPAPAAAKSQPPPSPSDSATESDSGTGSESDDPPVSAANPKAKPVAAKPLEESPKPKKPRPLPPQPSASAARSASKRAAENANEPKRAKKKVADSAGAGAAGDDEIPATEEDGGGGKKLGNDSKKLFQRIWSEEDEIAILKGLAEFTSKTGVDPYKDASAFHEFIKKSLRGEFSSNQLKEKIRRLRKKFENNAGRGKNGEGPKFAKQHEQRAYDLSKMVWASGGGGVEPEKSNAKTKKSQKDGGGGGGGGSSKNAGSANPKIELVQKDLKEDEQKGIDENGEDSTRMIRFDNVVGVSGLNEDVLKRGVGLIGASKRAELEERWKKLQVAELELYVNRAELIKDQARLIWEAYKSSNH